MAWFNKKDSAEVATLPATLDRVQAVFDAEGWSYEREESALHTGFSGISLVLVETELAIGIANQTNSKLEGEEGLRQVIDWAVAHHMSKNAPTLHGIVDEDGIAKLRADFSIPKAWEYSDAQFRDYLFNGTFFVIEAAKGFMADFDPELLAAIEAEGQSVEDDS